MTRKIVCNVCGFGPHRYPNENIKAKLKNTYVFGSNPKLYLENWLILPVIIFSDQRLSHACPRLNKLSVNLRMAQ